MGQAPAIFSFVLSTISLIIIIIVMGVRAFKGPFSAEPGAWIALVISIFAILLANSSIKMAKIGNGHVEFGKYAIITAIVVFLIGISLAGIIRKINYSHNQEIKLEMQKAQEQDELKKQVDAEEINNALPQTIDAAEVK